MNHVNQVIQNRTLCQPLKAPKLTPASAETEPETRSGVPVQGLTLTFKGLSLKDLAKQNLSSVSSG